MGPCGSVSLRTADLAEPAGNVAICCRFPVMLNQEVIARMEFAPLSA